MISLKVNTNLMGSQIKPAALRIAAVLVKQQYDIECASLIGSFLISCGVTDEEMRSLEEDDDDEIPTCNDLNCDDIQERSSND